MEDNKIQEGKMHYPVVYQFVLIALAAFDVYIFYTSDIQIKLYCATLFFILLNGWASSADDGFNYCSLYLLIDALCCCMYFLILLHLNNHDIITVWLLSAIIGILHILWNWLLILMNNYDEKKKKELKSYNYSNLLLIISSMSAYLILLLVDDYNCKVIFQILGGIIWFVLLGKWYYDNYFKTFKI